MFTVMSSTQSDLLTLSKQIFETYIIEEYPEILKEMSDLSIQREQRVREAKTKAKAYIKNMLREEFETDNVSEYLLSEDHFQQIVERRSPSSGSKHIRYEESSSSSHENIHNKEK